MRLKNQNGLQVVKKTYCGIEVGYVVGWWTRGRYSWRTRTETKTFRSHRQGVVFPTQLAAEKFRDKIENMRIEHSVQFEAVESE